MFHLRKTLYLLGLSTVVLPCLSYGMPKFVRSTIDSTEEMFSQHVVHPFYVGGGLGYGNTDWSEITTINDPNNFATTSAPIGATQSGLAYDGYMGYQFSEHFTIEAIYTYYPQTTVDFAPANIYGLSKLKTNTDTYSLLGKILVPFGFTKVYIYADAGATLVHRNDTKLYPDPINPLGVQVGKVNKYKMGASFGFGLAYNITSRLFAEGAFQYTTGYGKADIQPAEDYIPFVYSATINLAFRFGSNPKPQTTRPSPEERSIYLGLDAGYGNSHITSSMKNDANANGIRYAGNDGFTVGARAGYLFDPYVALQAEYYYLPEISIKRNSDITVANQSANFIAPEVKVLWPVIKDFSFFVKGGYGIVYVSNPAALSGYYATPGSKFSFEPVVGAGAEYRFHKRLGVYVQYTGIIDVNDKYPTTNLGAIGLSYYF